ncbi:MAG: flagellar biosynthesis protein FlgB [Alphaproteobacteria bacterium]|nr:flagellar biosynthesis protein FlgB [Alphaproteobacteria bacterium]
MIDNVQLFSMARQQMRWLSARQKVVAQNVANIDSPGYVARDLKPLTFREELDFARRRLQMLTTDPRHIQPQGNSRFTANRPRPFETTIDRNGVSLEGQMAIENQIRTMQEIALAGHGKHLQMMRKSIASN